ncbi:MAG: GxxExxY protein [Candidatus Riflebacteria bacterium]|nr:GxxExxY protein [Candidatus Riflebacteria bacterium]
MPDATERVATQVVDAAFTVHKTRGPGLLESVYELCLEHELLRREVPAEHQVTLPVVYRDLRVENGFRIDMVVAKCVVVELKAVESLQPIHQAQLLTYLRLSGYRLGFLLNFNVGGFKQGIRRLIL